MRFKNGYQQRCFLLWAFQVEVFSCDICVIMLGETYSNVLILVDINPLPVCNMRIVPKSQVISIYNTQTHHEQKDSGGA